MADRRIVLIVACCLLLPAADLLGHVTEIITQTKERHLPVMLAGDRDESAARARAKPFIEIGHLVYLLDGCREADILALARKLKCQYGLKPKFEVTGPACFPAAAVYRRHQKDEDLFTWRKKGQTRLPQ